jgi:hypothetical protein
VKTFPWLVGASSLCLLIGSALLLWGLKVVPISNPFNALVRDSPDKAETFRSDQGRASVGGDVRHGAVPRRSRAPGGRWSHQTLGNA